MRELRVQSRERDVWIRFIWATKQHHMMPYDGVQFAEFEESEVLFGQ